MLHLLSKQDEYLFLCKLPNRQEGYKQNMVGLFEQVLPIHVKLGAKNSMNGFMEYIRQQINRSERGLNAQSFLSKDKLFEKLNKCLSPVFFCYQETTAIDPCDFPDTNVRILDPELVVSNVELSFDMNVIGCNSSNVRKIEISYANNIFSESSIIKWVEYYLDILKAWVKLVPIIDRDENILEMLSIEEESSVCIPEENNSIYIENDDFAQGEQRVDQDLSSGPPDACQIDLGDDALDFQEDDSDPNHARQFNNGRSKVISWLKGRMM